MLHKLRSSSGCLLLAFPPWHNPEPFSAGATHLVAIELALKIVQKINAGQRFMAYIVLPLFPEGGRDSCDIEHVEI